MARIYLTKTLQGLAPADDEARDHLKKYNIGNTLAADVVKPREHRSLRRYWAMIKIVQENTDRFESRQVLHEYLKLRAGHFTAITSADGEVFKIANSLDYATLDETGFQEVWARIVDVVANEILPGIEIDSLELEIQRVCGLAA